MAPKIARIERQTRLHSENVYVDWKNCSNRSPPHIKVLHENFRPHLSRDLGVNEEIEIRIQVPGKEVGGLERRPLKSKYTMLLEREEGGKLRACLDMTNILEYIRNTKTYKVEIVAGDELQVWSSDRPDWFVLTLDPPKCAECCGDTSSCGPDVIRCELCKRAYHRVCAKRPRGRFICGHCLSDTAKRQMQMPKTQLQQQEQLPPGSEEDQQPSYRYPASSSPRPESSQQELRPPEQRQPLLSPTSPSKHQGTQQEGLEQVWLQEGRSPKAVSGQKGLYQNTQPQQQRRRRGRHPMQSEELEPLLQQQQQPLQKQREQQQCQQQQQERTGEPEGNNFVPVTQLRVWPSGRRVRKRAVWESGDNYDGSGAIGSDTAMAVSSGGDGVGERQRKRRRRAVLGSRKSLGTTGEHVHGNGSSGGSKGAGRVRRGRAQLARPNKVAGVKKPCKESIPVSGTGKGGEGTFGSCDTAVTGATEGLAVGSHSGGAGGRTSRQLYQRGQNAAEAGNDEGGTVSSSSKGHESDSEAIFEEVGEDDHVGGDDVLAGDGPEVVTVWSSKEDSFHEDKDENDPVAGSGDGNGVIDAALTLVAVAAGRAAGEAEEDAGTATAAAVGGGAGGFAEAAVGGDGILADSNMLRHGKDPRVIAPGKHVYDVHAAGAATAAAGSAVDGADMTEAETAAEAGLGKIGEAEVDRAEPLLALGSAPRALPSSPPRAQDGRYAGAGGSDGIAAAGIGEANPSLESIQGSGIETAAGTRERQQPVARVAGGAGGGLAAGAAPGSMSALGPNAAPPSAPVLLGQQAGRAAAQGTAAGPLPSTTPELDRAAPCRPPSFGITATELCSEAAAAARAADPVTIGANVSEEDAGGSSDDDGAAIEGSDPHLEALLREFPGRTFAAGPAAGMAARAAAANAAAAAEATRPVPPCHLQAPRDLPAGSPEFLRSMYSDLRQSLNRGFEVQAFYASQLAHASACWQRLVKLYARQKTRLGRRCSAMQQQQESQARQLEQYRMQLRRQADELKALQAVSAAALQAQSQSLEGEMLQRQLVSELQQRLKMMSYEKATLEAQKATFQQDLARLPSELASAQQELRQVEDARRRQQQEMQQQAEGLRRRHLQELEDVRRKHEDELQQAEDARQRLQQQLQEQADEAARRQQTLDAEVAPLQSQLATAPQGGRQGAGSGASAEGGRLSDGLGPNAPSSHGLGASASTASGADQIYIEQLEATVSELRADLVRQMEERVEERRRLQAEAERWQLMARRNPIRSNLDYIAHLPYQQLQQPAPQHQQPQHRFMPGSAFDYAATADIAVSSVMDGGARTRSLSFCHQVQPLRTWLQQQNNQV